LRLTGPQGHRAAGIIRSIEKSNDLIGKQTLDVGVLYFVDGKKKV
jgi:hypothetical protein